MIRRPRLPHVGLFLLLCSAPALAEESTARLYTNADLARPEAPTLERQPSHENDAESWEFVTAFLERSYAQFDAARDRDLARSILSAPESNRVRVGGRYGLGWIGYPGSARPVHPRGPRTTPHDSGRTAAIRPLHAGPSHTMRLRAQAIRHSGSNAGHHRGH